METCCWVGGCFRREVLCVRAWVGGRSNFARTEHLVGAVRARRPKRQRVSTTSFPWRRGLPKPTTHAWCFGFGSGGCVCLLCVCFVRKLSSVLYLSYAHQRHTHKPGSYHELTCRTAPESATARHAAVQLRRPLTVWLASSGRRQPSSRSSWRCSALLALVPHHWIRQRRTGRTMHPGSRLPWEEKTAGPLI